ncbi:hypothetical protein [uncultured Cellulomonas sp.]|uniref:hypothetical protein n=1 Tax=uncultured Cellulomonas sp. TaxID=189682 RepID=UPI0028E792D8|nr:hypothetical protein [uncultured Cellulomonas sp.]
MKRLIVFTAAAFVAAVPAAAGLAGNSSLSPSVPVAPPTQAVLVEPGDDSSVASTAVSPSAIPSAPSPSPSATPGLPTPSPSASVDDHGGVIDRDDRTEAGDDRDQNGGATAPAPAPTADDSGHGGSDDSGHEDGGRSGGGTDDGAGHDAGDDHGGHGSDD